MSMFEINYPKDQCAVITPVGTTEIDGKCTKDFLRAFDEVKNRRILNVVVDLTNVTFLSSAGIGSISEGTKDLMNLDGTIVLVVTDIRVKQLLDVTGLSVLVDAVVNSLESAMKELEAV